MKLKRHILSAIAVALSLILTFALVACGGSSDPKITAIAVDPTSKEMYVGDDPLTLKVNATYDDGTTARIYERDGVTFESSAPTVASVSKNGAVSASKAGTATITAKVGDLSATCAITVHAIEIVISGDGIEAGKLEMEVDDEVTLSAVVKIDGTATQETVVWSSSAPGLAFVNETTGALKAMNPGDAIITAKRANGAQTATIDVKVKEIEGAELMETYEQNKSPADTWGYWGDQGYNWSYTTISAAYTAPYEEETPETGFEYVGAGKMNLTYSIDEYLTWGQGGPNNSAIQLFYRSSAGNEGQLEVNHNYTVRLTILSNYAGTVRINPYDDNETGYQIDDGNEDAHDFELEANVAKTVEVTFRHGDSGAIYANGIYTNIESALMILLGLVGGAEEADLGNVVKVSVYDIQFKDLGESTYQWEDDPSELAGYVSNEDPADYDLGEEILPDNTNIIFSGVGEYDSPQDDTWMGWYVQDAGWSCGTVVVPENTETGWTLDDETLGITYTGGNVDYSVQLFYINTELKANAQYFVFATINVSADVTVKLNGKTLNLTEGENEVYALFKGKNTSFSLQVPGMEEESLTVTVSDVKWQEVLGSEDLKSATYTSVDVVKEGDHVYFIVEGTCENYTLEELKAALGLYLQSSDWDVSKNVTAQEADLEVTLESGNYTVKWDITNLAAGSYMAHFDPDFLGDEYGDLNHESSLDPAITNGNKTYDYVNGDRGGWWRYCLVVTES